MMMFNGVLVDDLPYSDADKVYDFADCIDAKLPREKCLQNLQSAVVVQRESLRVSERHIRALREANKKLTAKLNSNHHHNRLENSKNRLKDDQHYQQDVSAPYRQELEKQQALVKNLQANLAHIEDLYRNCFYESARQDAVIESLRAALLELRQKSSTSHSMHDDNRCQELSAQIENLKTEISIFVGGSNNDSGMWERSDCSSSEDISEELQDIHSLLTQLQNILNNDDFQSCHNDDNVDLRNEEREAIKIIKKENEDLNNRIRELENSILEKDNCIDRFKTDNSSQENEICSLKARIKELEDNNEMNKRHASERDDNALDLRLQMELMQATLKEKDDKFIELEREVEKSRKTISTLKAQLIRADKIAERSVVLNEEISELWQLIARWRKLLEQTAQTQNFLHKLLAESSSELSIVKRQLSAAQESGAIVVEQAKQAVNTIRSNAVKQMDINRIQEEQLREKDNLIEELRQRLEQHRSAIDACEASCSHSQRRERRHIHTCNGASEMDGSLSCRLTHANSTYQDCCPFSMSREECASAREIERSSSVLLTPQRRISSFCPIRETKRNNKEREDTRMFSPARELRTRMLNLKEAIEAQKNRRSNKRPTRDQHDSA